MKPLNKYLWIALLGILFLFSVGHATETQKNNLGFLSDYSKLKKSDWYENKADLAYIREGVDWNSYHSIIVEPVVLFFAGDAEYRGIDVEEMKHIADSFHKVMIDEISKVFKIVSEPGPGVLWFRSALTDVKPSEQGISSRTSVNPTDQAVSNIKKGAAGSRFFVGTASGEGELLDSTTNVQLMAAIDEKGGREVLVHKSFNEWDHTIDVFHQWAQRFRRRVEELRNK